MWWPFKKKEEDPRVKAMREMIQTDIAGISMALAKFNEGIVEQVRDISIRLQESRKEMTAQLQEGQKELMDFKKSLQDREVPYVMKGAFYLHPRKRRGSLIIKFNNEQCLAKLFEMFRDNK